MSGVEAAPDRARGITRLWDPRVWGTVVGAVGATVFVTEYRGVLSEPWPAVALGAWAVAFAAYLVLVFAVPRRFGRIGVVGPRQGLVYLGSVAGMLLLIALGTLALDSGGRLGLRPALIVIAVGLHFLPFARAFHTPMFTRLGVILAALGAVGLALGWIAGDAAAATLAVISGVVMLVVIAVDAARPIGVEGTTEGASGAQLSGS